MSKIYNCFTGLIAQDTVQQLQLRGLTAIHIPVANSSPDFFPFNYIDLVGKHYLNKTHDVILVDAVDVVIDGLVCVGIPIKIVYPILEAVSPQNHPLVAELESYYTFIDNPNIMTEEDSLCLETGTLAELIYADFTFTMVDIDVD